MPKIELTPAERSELRAAAHGLKPLILIGGDGLTEAVLRETDRTLAFHGLIKIRVFGDDRDTRLAIYEELCDKLRAAPIQHIGKLLVIWREGPTVFKHDMPSQRMEDARGKAASPKTVMVRKPTAGVRRARPKKVTVLGNERVTQGGNVKRAKSRQSSAKKRALD